MKVVSMELLQDLAQRMPDERIAPTREEVHDYSILGSGSSSTLWTQTGPPPGLAAADGFFAPVLGIPNIATGPHTSLNYRTEPLRPDAITTAAGIRIGVRFGAWLNLDGDRPSVPARRCRWRRRIRRGNSPFPFTGSTCHGFQRKSCLGGCEHLSRQKHGQPKLQSISPAC